MGKSTETTFCFVFGCCKYRSSVTNITYGMFLFHNFVLFFIVRKSIYINIEDFVNVHSYLRKTQRWIRSVVTKKLLVILVFAIIVVIMYACRRNFETTSRKQKESAEWSSPDKLFQGQWALSWHGISTLPAAALTVLISVITPDAASTLLGQMWRYVITRLIVATGSAIHSYIYMCCVNKRIWIIIVSGR